MKYERLRILYESKFNRKPYGLLFDGGVCFNTEIGLHDMRMHYLQKCEDEQQEALKSYEFIFNCQWNEVVTAITMRDDVSFRFTIMEMLIHEFMNNYTPIL